MRNLKAGGGQVAGPMIVSRPEDEGPGAIHVRGERGPGAAALTPGSLEGGGRRRSAKRGTRRRRRRKRGFARRPGDKNVKPPSTTVTVIVTASVTATASALPPLPSLSAGWCLAQRRLRT